MAILINVDSANIQQIGVTRWEVTLQAVRGETNVLFTLRLDEDVWQHVPGDNDEAKSQAVSDALADWLEQNNVNADDVLGLRLELSVPDRRLLSPIRVERLWKPN